MKQLVKIKIYGQVQGVSFRYYTKHKAGELGLKGMVKNLDNGSVYIEAEGKKEALKKFVAWCQTGSPWARVKEVKFNYTDDLKNYQDFKID